MSTADVTNNSPEYTAERFENLAASGSIDQRSQGLRAVAAQARENAELREQVRYLADTTNNYRKAVRRRWYNDLSRIKGRDMAANLTAEALLQALDEAVADDGVQLAPSYSLRTKSTLRYHILNRARELTAATPAPAPAGNDAVRALVADWRRQASMVGDIWSRNTFGLCADELESALADKAQSAGDEQEGV